MIGSIRGKLELKKPPLLLIEVGGIGYEIQASMSTFYQLPELGHEVFLYTHLIVREDAHILYGFYREQERALFRTLIKINNVGPKLALSILSGIDPDTFVRCILDQDLRTLTNVPGVGKKTAERLVVEMRDRVHDWASEHHLTDDLVSATPLPSNRVIQDAISALIALGFKPQEASRVISQIKEDYRTSEELIRYALQSTFRGKES